MLELGIFTSCDMSLNVGKTLLNAIAEFLEFIEVHDEGVDFFVDIAHFVNLFVDCAIRIYDGDSR